MFSVLQTCRQVDLAEHLNHACFFAKTRQVFKIDLLDGTSLEGFNVPRAELPRGGKKLAR